MGGECSAKLVAQGKLLGLFLRLRSRFPVSSIACSSCVTSAPALIATVLGFGCIELFAPSVMLLGFVKGVHPIHWFTVVPVFALAPVISAAVLLESLALVLETKGLDFVMSSLAASSIRAAA